MWTGGVEGFGGFLGGGGEWVFCFYLLSGAKQQLAAKRLSELFHLRKVRRKLTSDSLRILNMLEYN